MMYLPEETFRMGGEILCIREPELFDAQYLMEFVSKIDSESPYMLREPGEFDANIRREKNIIRMAQGSDDICWLVAFRGRTPVATAGWSRVSHRSKYRHRAEVGVAVLKEAQRGGLGRRMMQLMAESAKKAEVLQLELTVAESNLGAIALYESLGYQKVGTAPRAVRYKDGSFENEHRMVLLLDK